MTCPDIGYSMPRKKFDSGKIRVLILNVYAACPEPDTSPYFRFSQEYGFVSTNIGTMTQLISHSDGESWLGCQVATDLLLLRSLGRLFSHRKFISSLSAGSF